MPTILNPQGQAVSNAAGNIAPAAAAPAAAAPAAVPAPAAAAPATTPSGAQAAVAPTTAGTTPSGAPVANKPVVPGAATPAAAAKPAAAPAASDQAIDAKTKAQYEQRLQQLQAGGMDIKSAQNQLAKEFASAGTNARNYEIWSNLEEGKKNQSSAFSSRAAFDQAYGYNMKNDQEKSIMDAFWNANAPKSTSDYLGRLAAGEQLSGGTTQEKNAQKYFSLIGTLATKDATALSAAVDSGIITPGSSAWQILAAKNPALTQQFELKQKAKTVLSSVNSDIRSSAARNNGKVSAAGTDTKDDQDPVAKATGNIAKSFLTQNPEAAEPTTASMISTSMENDPEVAQYKTQMKDSLQTVANLKAQKLALETTTRQELKRMGVEGPLAESYIAAKVQPVTLQLQQATDLASAAQSMLSVTLEQKYKDIQAYVSLKGLSLDEAQQKFNQDMSLKNYNLEVSKFDQTKTQFAQEMALSKQKLAQDVAMKQAEFAQEIKMAGLSFENQAKLAAIQTDLQNKQIQGEIYTDPNTMESYVVNKKTGERIGDTLSKGLTGLDNDQTNLVLEAKNRFLNTGASNDKATAMAISAARTGKTMEEIQALNPTSSDKKTQDEIKNAIVTQGKLHNQKVNTVKTSIGTATKALKDALASGKSTVSGVSYVELLSGLANAFKAGNPTDAEIKALEDASMSKIDRATMSVKGVSSSDSVPVDSMLKLVEFARNQFVKSSNEAYHSTIENQLAGVSNQVVRDNIEQLAGADYLNAPETDIAKAVGKVSDVAKEKGWTLDSKLASKIGEKNLALLSNDEARQLFSSVAKKSPTKSDAQKAAESNVISWINSGATKNQIRSALNEAGTYDDFAYLLWGVR